MKKESVPAGEIKKSFPMEFYFGLVTDERVGSKCRELDGTCSVPGFLKLLTEMVLSERNGHKNKKGKQSNNQ